MNKERHSECLLYNMYRTNSHSSNKHIREYGCSGSEYVPSGEIDWVCKNRCKWYRPEIVDAYASDKALWRRRLSMTDLRHKERGEDDKISL